MFERLYYQESRAEAQELVHRLLEGDAFDPDSSLNAEIPDLMGYATKAARKPWGYMLRLPAFMEMNGKQYPRREVWLNARRSDFQQYIGNGTVFKRQSTTKQWPNLQTVPVYEDPRKYGERVLDPNFVPPAPRRPRLEGMDDEIDPLNYAHGTVDVEAMAKELGFKFAGKNTADRKDPRNIWTKDLRDGIEARMTVGSDPTRVNIFFYKGKFGQPDWNSVGEIHDATANEVREAILKWEKRRTESLDDEIRDLKAYAMQHGLPPRILITFNKTTPESAETGEWSDSGWIDEEGVSMAPDEIDQEEGKTAVDLAVEYLWKEGATDHSSSGFDQGGWYSTGWSTTDNNTGEEEERNYHLEGFTPQQEREIYDKLMALRHRR